MIPRPILLRANIGRGNPHADTRLNTTPKTTPKPSKDTDGEQSNKDQRHKENRAKPHRSIIPSTGDKV